MSSPPVIPTSSQYGLAIVDESNINHGPESAAAQGLQDGQLGADRADFDHVHNRFKVVKIVSTQPTSRGRWVCMDYFDQMMTSTGGTGPSSSTANTQKDTGSPQSQQQPLAPLQAGNVPQSLPSQMYPPGSQPSRPNMPVQTQNQQQLPPQTWTVDAHLQQQVHQAQQQQLHQQHGLPAPSPLNWIGNWQIQTNQGVLSQANLPPQSVIQQMQQQPFLPQSQQFPTQSAPTTMQQPGNFHQSGFSTPAPSQPSTQVLQQQPAVQQAPPPSVPQSTPTTLLQSQQPPPQQIAQPSTTAIQQQQQPPQPSIQQQSAQNFQQPPQQSIHQPPSQPIQPPIQQPLPSQQPLQQQHSVLPPPAQSIPPPQQQPTLQTVQQPQTASMPPPVSAMQPPPSQNLQAPPQPQVIPQPVSAQVVQPSPQSIPPQPQIPQSVPQQQQPTQPPIQQSQPVPTSIPQPSVPQQPIPTQQAPVSVPPPAISQPAQSLPQQSSQQQSMLPQQTVSVPQQPVMTGTNQTQSSLPQMVPVTPQPPPSSMATLPPTQISINSQSQTSQKISASILIPNQSQPSIYQPSSQPPQLAGNPSLSVVTSIPNAVNAAMSHPISAVTGNFIAEAIVKGVLEDQASHDAQLGDDPDSASGTNTVAIDNKIEQAMDLVKSHLMFAVREEVEVLKEKISELMDRISQLEYENTILKANATQETLAQIMPSQHGAGGGGGNVTSLNNNS